MKIMDAWEKELHPRDYRRCWVGGLELGMRSGMNASLMMMNFVARHRSKYDT